MPAADSLASLMGEWPLNSTTLFVATHSKLRRAADGTGTPVMTYMINKWTAKINRKEIYNWKCPPERGGGRKKEKKERKMVAVLTTLESFCRSALKNEEEESFLKPSPRINLYPSFRQFDHPIPLWSCPAVGALTKTQFLSPFSLPNLLYRACWVWAHLRQQ